MTVTKVQDEVAWYLIHTTVSRMLKETYESRDRGFDNDDGVGRLATGATTAQAEESTFISWKWSEEGHLFLCGFAGGPFPEVLTEKQRQDLVELGWQLPENPVEAPCLWECEVGQHDFTLIADTVIATMRDVYGVKADWVWKFGPHDLAREIFEPSCDDILVMVAELRSRNIHDVIEEEISFIKVFETPQWLRPWS